MRYCRYRPDDPTSSPSATGENGVHAPSGTGVGPVRTPHAERPSLPAPRHPATAAPSPRSTRRRATASTKDPAAAWGVARTQSTSRVPPPVAKSLAIGRMVPPTVGAVCTTVPSTENRTADAVHSMRYRWGDPRYCEPRETSTGLPPTSRVRARRTPRGGVGAEQGPRLVRAVEVDTEAHVLERGSAEGRLELQRVPGPVLRVGPEPGAVDRGGPRDLGGAPAPRLGRPARGQGGPVEARPRAQV